MYGASEPDLNIISTTLYRSLLQAPLFFFFPFPLRIFYIDRTVRFSISVNKHPLGSNLPPKNDNKYNLRKEQCALPKVNTERFMTSYQEIIKVRE